MDIAKSEDEEIIKRVQNGDKEFYSHIIKRYQDKLLRYARYLTGDIHKSEDVVQQAFIKAYINLKGFDAKKKFSSWIYRIVHNEAINTIGKKGRIFSIDDRLDFDSGIDLTDELIKKEMSEKAHECLKQIPLIYREPLELYFMEEKSYEEISDILRIPIGTVGTRINRAKAMMRKACKKTEVEQVELVKKVE